METSNQDTLDAIIRAAKNMASRKNLMQGASLSAQASQEKDEEKPIAKKEADSSAATSASDIAPMPAHPAEETSTGNDGSLSFKPPHRPAEPPKPDSKGVTGSEVQKPSESAFGASLQSAPLQSDSLQSDSLQSDPLQSVCEPSSKPSFKEPADLNGKEPANPAPEEPLPQKKTPCVNVSTPQVTSSATLSTVGIHFLEFAVAFLTLAKCQYQHDSDVKVNSLPFFTLIALDSWAEEDYTMSELAEKLQITKQQFSRLINDLEERGLVERIHDKSNRRRVYIRICEQGRLTMENVKQDMLNCTLQGLRSYSMSELAEMDFCICRLTELMEKFNTDPK